MTTSAERAPPTGLAATVRCRIAGPGVGTGWLDRAAGRLHAFADCAMIARFNPS